MKMTKERAGEVKKIISGFTEKLGEKIKNLTLWLVLFSVLLWTIGLPGSSLFPPAEAAINVSVSTTGLYNGEMPEMPIATSSQPTAIIRLNIDTVSTPQTLTSIQINFSGYNFSTSTLAALATNAGTGVGLYNDAGAGSAGNFAAGDVFISANSSWAGNSVTLTPSATENLVSGQNIYYIAIRTSALGPNGSQIMAAIPAGGVIASTGTGPGSLYYANSLIIDTYGPTVLKAEYVNSHTVDIVFSERIQPSGTSTQPSVYSLNGGTTVTSVMPQGSNIIRLVTGGTDLSTSTSQVTVAAGVQDYAGNAGPGAVGVNVTEPNKVKIGEVALAYQGTANAQYVELYNGGGNAVDIGNWRLEYSDASPVNWISLATVTPSTMIAPNSFYMISTTQFDSLGAPDGNLNFTAISTGGGHLRIVNSNSVQIDKLGWGGATSPEGTAASPFSPSSISLERKAFGNSLASDLAAGGRDAAMGNGWDTDSNAFDFVVQATSSPQNASSTPETASYSGGGGGSSGPMINFAPVFTAPTGADLNIVAQMGDPMGQSSLTAELHYKVGDSSAADETPGNYTTAYGTAQSNGYYRFTIPQATIDNANSATYGVFYYLKLIGTGGTRYMSSSPSADGAGDETNVSRNPFVAMAQSSAGWVKHNINGTTTDSSSLPVANALVFLEGTGYNMMTGANGSFSLTNVKDGIYNLRISKSGFYEQEFRDIYLNGTDYNFSGAITLNAGTGGGTTGDNTKPKVNWTGPPDGMINVQPGDPNFKIFVGFSKDLSASTFTNSNVKLATQADINTNLLSSGAVIYNPQPRTNMPSDQYMGAITVGGSGLATNTTYYLIMTGSVRDNSGNSLEGNRPEGGHVVSFSTGNNFSGGGGGGMTFGMGAMMPPFVMGVNPNNGMMNVPQNTKIYMNFSEPMEAASITTAGNIKLEKVSVSGTTETVTDVGMSAALDTTLKIAVITPTINLTAGKYRVRATGALKSSTGVWMGDPNQSQNTSSFEMYRSYFEAGSTVDSTKPTVTDTWPVNSTNNTNISVSPGPINIQFSEAMDPSTINANTVTLKRGTSAVTGSITYDAMGHSASFVPTVILATAANYTLTIAGSAAATSSSVTDASGNPLNSDKTVTFTTASTSDTANPKIMFAKGDDFGLAITFDESMNSAKITDTANWPKSVLNKNNFLIKQGAYNASFASGFAAATSTINLSNANFTYDANNKTVMIDNISGVVGLNYYIEMASSTAAGQGGGGASDLAGNPLYNPTNFQTPAENSANTKGMLGPNMGGGGGGMMGPSMGSMGMMKAGAFPMNATAGQTTVYFVDLPISQAIANGYKIALTFPSGFDITGAKKDTYSPVNRDINEWNSGTITFATTTESSGGAANDGVTVDTAARTVTISLVVSGTPPAGDFLHLDLAGIVNSSIPRGFDTSGYTVDLKIMKADGTLSETVNGMPFFINQGGALTLGGSITLSGATGSTDGSMKLYLGSPMTGPMDQTVTITNGAGSYAFSGLSAGSYMLFTDPTLSMPDGNWIGLSMPEPVNISASTTKNLTFSKESVAGALDLTVNLSGNFNSTDIDVFAGSPQGFKVKTFYGATSSLPAVHFYLPAGDWMIGVGPAMPKGVMSGPPPMPDWMPPMPQMVKSLGTGTSSVTLSINSANLQLIGYVQDESGGAIADAEVYAYQPGNSTGMGAHARTDTAGKFTLKLASAGNYTVGTFKPGLPNVPEKFALVAADTDSGATDGNSTADVTADGRLITAANKFIFKITKPGRTISGKVTNGTNPVSYAPVWADKVGSFSHTDTMTDASGNYILYVDAGAWRVQSYIPGFGNAEPQTVMVGTTDVTQNLAPETGITYYTIGGTITIGGTAQAYRPIRAVQYNGSGVYTGKEYHGQTDSSGVYSISVPGSNNYRVDIWTQEYGEVGLNTDEVADSPANVIIGSANVTGKDITITAGNLIDVSLAFANKAGYSGKEAFLNIEGVGCSGAICKSNGFRMGLRITDLNTFSDTIKLKATANYFFSLDIPGFGNYIPITNASTGLDPTTGSVAATTTSRTVSFTLPDTSASTVAISGAVLEGAASSSGAWVWVGNPTNGYRNGVKTSADGTYSITIPTGSGYKMGADKPGYMSNDPLSFDATTTTAITGRNFTLTAKSLVISGYIYSDANLSSAMDAGEALPGGWVRAETSDGKKTQAPTDGTGYFELGVVNGSWTVYGIADGYLETAYSSAVTVAGVSVPSINVKLSANSSWSNKNKKTPITPASGGTMDDTAPDGSGVKLVVPPNALGNSSAAGNLTAAVTSAVAKTNSSEPFADQGRSISATDNSGQAITSLNDYIDIEMVIYKADVVAQVAADGTGVYAKLKNTKNSYWDSTASDWVAIATTRTAYYKNTGDTEWKLYSNASASSSFEAFIDTLPGSYADYKLVYTSKTNHLTIFAVIMPFVATPAQAAPATPASPASPSGGAGSSGSACLTVVYDEWQNVCANGFQYRNVKYQGPEGCLLTAAQESQRKRTCGAAATTTAATAEPLTQKAAEAVKQAVVKVNLYLAEAKRLIKNNITTYLKGLKLKVSAAKVNLYTRLYLNGLVKNVKGLNDKNKTTLIRFITYGTDSTKKLSAKQRANVLGTYKKVTGKLPITEKEWSDAISLGVVKKK